MKFTELKNQLDLCIDRKNLRHSEQRYIILKALWEESDKHLSAEEIYDRVKQDEDIGIATVYRALKLFKSCSNVSEFLLIKFDLILYVSSAFSGFEDCSIVGMLGRFFFA